MALPKIDEVRQLNDEELAEEIIATKRKLFDLRFQQATRQLENTHEFKHTRHRMAQLLTVERERQLDINQSSSTEVEEA
ncbi:50S ribosomal protein L29 [Crocosphaera chwakensis]|uniref:Large ribosomal subunit protein uL29 n=1 Tax=Crocosphaera chwakensis CCY0110 TaxID=391612 RepID=A3IQ11_9CHRO|nr:50S ribosomal protein L29 [Crocosphaera chwakensis]EAZ91351.1 50S ribosomal protein L29 [Crocosphaera chwakensis CCY0110]